MDKKLIQRTMNVQRELTKSGLSRRNLLKLGVLSASTGMLLPIKGLSLRPAMAAGAITCPIPGVDIISPRTTPFKDPLQRLEEMAPTYTTRSSVSELTDAMFLRGGKPGHAPTHELDSKLHLLKEHPELSRATPFANLAHQGWDGTDKTGGLLAPPKDFYEMRAIQHKHVWHSEMPAGAAGQLAWGFADRKFDNAAQVTGTGATTCTGVPGPVFRLRYGRSHLVRIYNELPATAQDQVSALGFGTSTIATHMHNHHTPSESDGGPLYYNYAGHFWDHHYPNLYAGINQWQANGAAKQTADAQWNPSGVRGDFREALGSLWFHDHKHDFTSQNVYAGLFGACPIYDDVDTGDETKLGTTGIRFPTHSQDAGSFPYEFDVPLMVHDRQFDPNGVDFFPLACLDGAIGDKMTVNGTVNVGTLNGLPVARDDAGLGAVVNRTETINVLTNDFAPAGVNAATLRITQGPCIAATAGCSAGSARFNALGQLLFTPPAPGVWNMTYTFDDKNGATATPGVVTVNAVAAETLLFQRARWTAPKKAGQLGTLDAAGTSSILLTHTLELRSPNATTGAQGCSNGAWNSNGVTFDRSAPPYDVKEGTAEVWVHKNGGGSWSHPIHPHYEEGRILKYNGAATPDVTAPLQTGRKDVYLRGSPGLAVSHRKAR